ncbi:hypothetical protein [Sabulibacter ruber]|uniref:hypothetical protein n=1 Tax=Sabulibacter ruber TaxID=2811901 RepID=UPI001A964654|nr:hypothetical protein [Sabulibacter ruber]
MKKILPTLVFAFIMNSLHAQSTTPPEKISRNTVFLEIGGNSLVYSLNYDRILVNKPTFKLAGRIGGMYLKNTGIIENGGYHMYSFPLELSYLHGKGNHHLEIGVGVNPSIEKQFDFDRTNYSIFPLVRLGYRYQRSDGGLFFKAGFTPIIQTRKDIKYITDSPLAPWGGIAIGYTLKN